MPPSPASACFRFYAELNDHLPLSHQYRTVVRQFFVPASVRDMIESLGVPHTEVDLVLVNGESSDFTRPVQNGDRVTAYPMFESIDITPVLRLRPQPLREPKFVLDVHLGRLAGYLRMLGFEHRVCQLRQRSGTGANLHPTKAHPADKRPWRAKTLRGDARILVARD